VSMSRGRRLLIEFGLVVGALVGWRRFSPYDMPALTERLGGDLAKLWSFPYFTIGNLAITPAFLVKVFVYVVLLALLSRSLRYLLRERILTQTALGEGQRFAVERGVSYLVILFGVLIGLESVGLNLTSLAVIGGTIGIGIGFGLQSIANNFVSGLILLVEQPVKVGDRIEVEAVSGRVVKVGIRATWVRTNANRVIIVPNSEFISNRVTNWTAGDQLVRFAIPMGVSYGSDPKRVRQILLEVARAHPDVLGNPDPDVIFIGFGDSSLDFELRIWTIKQVQTPKTITSDLYFATFEAFRQHGIEIPFPQRDLHVRSISSPIPISGAEPARLPA